MVAAIRAQAFTASRARKVPSRPALDLPFHVKRRRRWQQEGCRGAAAASVVLATAVPRLSCNPRSCGQRPVAALHSRGSFCWRAA